jgi:hypothetical protein
MAQFNEKEHLQNITSLSEELAKLLKNSMVIVGKEFREIGDLTVLAKNLMAGKRSPLLDMNPYEDSKKGKYVLNYVDNKPKLHFIERQEILQIPAAYKQFLSQEDIDNMQKYGNANRVIYVDVNGVATPKYFSLDKETNTIATMSAHKLSFSDTILGVSLTQEQKDNLRQGNPIFVKGLHGKDGAENWDAVISVDAVSKGLSFNKVSVTIPKEILGVTFSEAQRESLKNGETILIHDLISKTSGNKFSANISLQEGQLDIKPMNYTPKRLLGLDLTDKQRHQLMSGESLYLEGMISKADKKFNATVSFDTLHGIKFDFEKKPNKSEVTSEVTVETPKIEKATKISLVDDGAYKGNLKKTPSLDLGKEKVVKQAIEKVQKVENSVKNKPKK